MPLSQHPRFECWYPFRADPVVLSAKVEVRRIHSLYSVFFDTNAEILHIPCQYSEKGVWIAFRDVIICYEDDAIRGFPSDADPQQLGEHGGSV